MSVANTESAVILIRHAQSQWNLENRFSGWADPPLTEAGLREAVDAGRLLHARRMKFDIAFCSRLQRARDTMRQILAVLDQQTIRQIEDWRLNERHYGTLQGNIKTAEANDTSEEQIWRWRRSYLDKADALAMDDPRHPLHSELYRDVPPERLPGVENLAETRVRIEEFWQECVVPKLKDGRRILISSHGNALRALLMSLADMSVDEVESFEIPTGQPIIVRYKASGQFLSWSYLKDEPS